MRERPAAASRLATVALPVVRMGNGRLLVVSATRNNDVIGTLRSATAPWCESTAPEPAYRRVLHAFRD